MNQTNSDKNLMTIALWLLGSLLVLPFSLNYRYHPYIDFFQDITIVIFATGALLCILYTGYRQLKIPRVSLVLVAMALYWCLQPVVLEIPYENESYRAALFFLIIAGLCVGIRELVYYFGQQKVIKWIAYGVVIGAVFQSIVATLQAANIVIPVFIFYDFPNVGGQFGQRNHLGHYLMWGIVASAYLIVTRQIGKFKGVALLFFIGSSITLVNSRSIIVYIVALLIFYAINKAISRKKDASPALLTFTIAIIWVILAQWIMPYIYELLGISSQSAWARLQETGAIKDTSSQIRFQEWHKAWLVFKENIFWGVGFNGFGYESFIRDIDIVPDSHYHASAYTTHSHNSILQILAEMGIVGFLIIVLGGLWALLPILKTYKSSESILILSLILITTCHSLLEYPLWYTNFLACFIVFFALEKESKPEVLGGRFSFYLISVFSLTCLAGCITLFTINQINISKQLQKSMNMTYVRAQAMIQTAQKFSFLFADYAEINDINKIKPTDKLDKDTIKKIETYSRYMPTSYIAELYGFVLYRQNKTDDSKKWFKKTWHKYPRLVPQSMKVIYDNSPIFSELEQPVYEACKRYYSLNLYPKVFTSECKQPSSNSIDLVN